mgnify:CR=1 FL=1
MPSVGRHLKQLKFGARVVAILVLGVTWLKEFSLRSFAGNFDLDELEWIGLGLHLRVLPEPEMRGGLAA